MTNDAERITDILRYSPGACLIVDDGVVKGANSEAISVTRIPRNRLVGAELAEIMVDEHQERVHNLLSTIDAGVGHAETRLSHGLIPLHLSARRLSSRLVIIGVRHMELEHRLSAEAGGDLTHDAVTGLPDRFHVLEKLHERLTIATNQPLALIGIWVDDLAELRESRGDRVVERVCRQVGERIQARLRGPDLLGRFDDAAFLALLTTDSDLEQLTEIADRLRNEVAFPVEFDGGLVSFTASVMVASVGPKRPTIDRVLSRLETVGKKAAATGGNRTDVFSL
ncbi:MAG: GGDEF domain-containing protein [Acidimicrobiales bacterium]